jgi:5-methylcytosine-specific restriction endonuclease McrA
VAGVTSQQRVELNRWCTMKVPRKAKTKVTVLCYSPRETDRTTVRRSYFKWRKQREMPLRCDNPACCYHTSPLKWNGQDLPVIVDHISGNHNDNTPDNLRLLCPNCDALQKTRGGSNKGRIQNVKVDGYQLVDRKENRIDGISFPTGQEITSGTGTLTPVGGTPVRKSRRRPK